MIACAPFFFFSTPRDFPLVAVLLLALGMADFAGALTLGIVSVVS